MPIYRVTYADCTLRERFIEAPTVGEAERAVQAELDMAEHHHAIDGWTDDWQVEVASSPPKAGHCLECGR